MTFTFDFELHEAEHVRGSRVVMNRQRSTRVAYVGFAFFIVAGPLLWLARPTAGGGRQDGGLLAGLIVLFGFVGLVALYWSPRTTVRNLRKNNRTATEPHRYVFDDKGLDARSTGATTTVDWANFAEIRETKEFFLFYISKTWAILLPKRAVAPDVLGPFRSAIAAWAGERAHLLPNTENA